MEIIPAIDLMNGSVVRLFKGDQNRISTYDHLGDPQSIAQTWESQGAKTIHIVDLDAAFGQKTNLKSITTILEEVKVPLQVGGGIRNVAGAQSLLNIGVKRVILGSLAFKDPLSIVRLLDEFGSESIAVALDYRKGETLIRGWKASTGRRVEDALQDFLKLGVRMFLITSAQQDGTLEGPDLETLEILRNFRKAEIIAAGGIGNLQDLLKLAKLDLQGAVMGKAIYEGIFTLEEAITAVKRRL